MAPNSLYNYALDMTVFFRYLESIDYKIDTMTLKDLEGITPQDIEDYLEYVSTCKKDGITMESSSCTVTRRYSSLSSFFNYYYQLDMIDRNPVSKVSRPKPRKNPSEIPSNDTNLELLDYVINGELDGRKSVFREYTKERDIAIILLIMGAGIKGSDVVNLDIGDLHLKERYITVRSRKSTREVFISDTIARAVSEYLEKRLDIIAEHGDDDALFLSLNYYRRICLRSVQKMVKKYSSAMFSDKASLTPTALRQSFRNNIFHQSGNVRLASAASGDSDEYVLQRYKAYLEQYECRKGRDFSVDIF